MALKYAGYPDFWASMKMISYGSAGSSVDRLYMIRVSEWLCQVYNIVYASDLRLHRITSENFGVVPPKSSKLVSCELRKFRRFL